MDDGHVLCCRGMMSAPISFPLCSSFSFSDKGRPNVNLIWSDVWRRWVNETDWASWFGVQRQGFQMGNGLVRNKVENLETEGRG